MTNTFSPHTEMWKRINALLEVGMAMPPKERRAWLEGLTGTDAALKPRLEAMLERADTASDFMDKPVPLAAWNAEAHAGEDHPDDIVGPYRLIAPIGEGGMGTVWSAERADGSLQRRVALKLPATAWSPGLDARLRRESAILATLEHPNIARVYDAGVGERGRPYLAMESIDGAPIDEYCRDKALTVAERLRLFVQVANAVAFAHARLVVHRDLKPSNILVDAAGNAHIVDFGIAKLLDAEPESSAPSHLTQMHGRVFTPDYASPEQIRGWLVTVASDVYSLGVVLYELLAGKRPYRLPRGGALEEAIDKVHAPPPSTQVGNRAAARELRGDLDMIVDRAMRKDAAERYPSVQAFSNDVERYLRGEPIHARPDTFIYRAGKFVRRHRAGVALGGLLVLVTIAGVTSVVKQSQIARAERDKALTELRYAQAAEEFTQFLLSEQTGRPVEPQELLRRARKAVVGQFADDPALRARMQIVLAALYGEINDFAQTEALLREARAAAYSAGDRTAVAQAECALGSVLGTTGREKEAAELFAAHLPSVDADPDIGPRAVQDCHAWRGNYRRNRNLPGSGDDFKAALQSMETTGSIQRTARIRLKASIADSYVTAGRVPEALALYEEASAELAGIGRSNTSSGWGLANNQIFTLVQAGHLKAVEPVYVRAVGVTPAEGMPSPDLAIAMGRVLVDIGRLDAAERLLEAAAADKERIGHRRGEAYALLGIARLKCVRDAEIACTAAIEKARAKFAAFERPAHSSFATFRYLRGVAYMERKDAAAARPWLEESIALFDKAPDRNPLRVRALSLLALCLDDLGQDARARESAALAVATARTMTEGVPESEWVGSALLAQARVHERQGDVAAARTMAAEAKRHLEPTLGMDAPVLRKWEPMLRRLEA
jgi:tetratricopeptide (TPR) repeat protein